MTEVVKYSPALDAEIVADTDSMEYAYQGRNQFGGVVVGIADWYIHDTITDQKIAIHEGRVYPLVGTLNTFVRHAVLGTTRDGRYRFIQQWRHGLDPAEKRRP